MGYLETLNRQATLGDVFHDLDEKVWARIKVNEQLLADSAKNSSDIDCIPGTGLMLTRGGAIGDYPDERYLSTYLCARIGRGFRAKRVRLLSRTIRTGPLDVLPYRVGGYRGNEYTSDYSFRCELVGKCKGLIACKLGGLGLGEMSESAPDPIGERYIRPARSIESLGDAERSLVDVIVQGINNNLTAVELLQEGIDAIEVLDAMDRTAPDL